MHMMKWISIDDVDVKEYDFAKIVDARQEIGISVFDGDVAPIS